MRADGTVPHAAHRPTGTSGVRHGRRAGAASTRPVTGGGPHDAAPPAPLRGGHDRRVDKGLASPVRVRQRDDVRRGAALRLRGARVASHQGQPLREQRGVSGRVLRKVGMSHVGTRPNYYEKWGNAEDRQEYVLPVLKWSTTEVR